MKIGLYSPFFGSTIGGGEKYLGVTAEALRDAFPGHQVEIISPVRADVARYERMLGLDLRGIGIRSATVHSAGIGRRLRRIPIVRRYADLYLAVRSVGWTRGYDLFLSMVYVMPAFSRARRGVILCQFPYERGEPLPKGHGTIALLYDLYNLPYRLLRQRLLGTEEESFQLVICQSEYVRHWVSRYWNRDSVVINPPIDVPSTEPAWDQKRRIILSVGRFFRSGHCKRQDIMVDVFRHMCDTGLTGWELHLVGSVHHGSRADTAFFETVCSKAEGYPIHIHPDASLEKLQDLYRRASIYWHAAGYGVDALQRPIDLEHFGMTTAEAMGYGAVPVVIGRGGQVEIVEDGVTGFLWDTPERLAKQTGILIQDTAMRLRMGKAARQASHRFGREEFKRRMAETIRPLVHELQGCQPAMGTRAGRTV